MSLNKLSVEIPPAFACGDKDAFIEIYRHYQQVIFNNIIRLIPQRDTAEDILQEVFLKLWQHRQKFHDEKSIASWLFTVSYNHSISHIRQVIKEKRYMELQFSESYPEHLNLEETEIQTIKEKILNDAINQLPLRKKQAFELCKLQGKSYNEAAVIMGISSETVKEHMAASLKFIKSYVIDHHKMESLLTIYLIGLFFKA